MSNLRMREQTTALNQLQIQLVGSYLGLKLPLFGMTHCPLLAHDDKTPSFEVRMGGRRWICYSCDLRGGPIDLVKSIRGLSFLEAKRWLSQRTGDALSGNVLGRQARPAQKPHTNKLKKTCTQRSVS